MGSQVLLPTLSSAVTPHLFPVTPPATKRPPKLLSIENDEPLLLSRNDVLLKAGCRVRSCTASKAAELIHTISYEVIVFGHSLSDAECGQLAFNARRHNAKTKLLLLQALEPRAVQLVRLFDSSMQSSQGPATLVTVVKDLLASVLTK